MLGIYIALRTVYVCETFSEKKSDFKPTSNTYTLYYFIGM